MNNYIKEQVKAHALREFPNECCGFICVNKLGVVTVVPCENEARNKRNRFSINPAMNVEVEKYGYVIAFYHSHSDEVANPEREHFSREDLDISREACIPALLYVYPQDKWLYHQPDTYQPLDLLGRPFIWGVFDCYSLVRDFYKIQKGVILNYYFPPSEESEKVDFGYERHIQNERFEEVSFDDLQGGDVLLFKIKSDFINHSAIYLGNNEYLHQPIKKLSSIVNLDERYFKYIAKALRYKYE